MALIDGNVRINLIGWTSNHNQEKDLIRLVQTVKKNKKKEEEMQV